MSNVLVHVEGGMELPTTGGPSVRVPVDRDGEATFSVDEAGHPARIELERRACGFLLIVRTGRIVTAHAVTLAEGYDTHEYRRILGCSSI